MVQIFAMLVCGILLGAGLGIATDRKRQAVRKKTAASWSDRVHIMLGVTKR